MGGVSAMRTDDWLGRGDLMRPWFAEPSWSAWRAFSKALWGEPMTAPELEVYRARTGRTQPPARQAREAWVAVGRRGGKSIVMAREAVRCAVRDYSAILKPGARAHVVVLASDRSQAQEVQDYINGFFENVPALAAMVEKRRGKGPARRDEVRLTNRVTVRVAVASFRKIRGRTIVAAILDEICYWFDGERSANPSEEILRALRPAMLTVPDPLLLVISSPYRRQGPMFEALKRHHGRDGDPVLTWRGDTLSMNPAADKGEIARAFEEDPVAAASEYGRDGDVQFRTDLETFVSPESVDACTVRGRAFLAYDARFRHGAGADVAGGSGGDEFAVSIVRRERGRAVVCLTRSWKPPFSPDKVTEEACALLKEYGITRVVGDAYAGDWPTDRFKAHGIAYVKADRTRSEFYQALLPIINSGKCELLDDARTNGQLLALERSTSRLGRDSITHPPNGKDDRINALAIAAVLAVRKPMMAAEGERERARAAAPAPQRDRFGAHEEIGGGIVYRVFEDGRRVADRAATEQELLEHEFRLCPRCGDAHLTINGESACPRAEQWSGQEVLRRSVAPTAHPEVRLYEQGHERNIALTAKTLGWEG